MGRIDTNSGQYQPGVFDEFQEFHAEAIDDAPPHEEDLYEPPPTDNKPPPLPTPQALFPPPQDHPAAAVHSFPPKQDDKQPQPFPPPDHQQTPQPFPPDFNSSGNQYIYHQQQAFPQQPVVGGVPVGFSPSPLIPQPTQPWKTHLFHCMKNPQNAIITLFFPCITFGQIAEILDSGSTSCGTSGMLYSLIACCIAIPCIMSCTYRSKLRSKFGLIESPAPDWVVHCFCECCALCQEYRELQERGFDPSIGWSGNEAKQRQMVRPFGTMIPPMQQRMI